jgi:hypothetical protein
VPKGVGVTQKNPKFVIEREKEEVAA